MADNYWKNQAIKLKKQRDAQIFPERFVGYLGDGRGNAASNLVVPSNKAYVYYRLHYGEENSGVSVAKMNRNVRPLINLPVILEKSSKGEITIVGVDDTIWEYQTGASVISGTQPHHVQHEFGGGDEVFVGTRTLKIGLVVPTDPESMKVKLSSFVYSDWGFFSGGLTNDLSVYQLDEGNRYVTISYDPKIEKVVYQAGGKIPSANATWEQIIQSEVAADSFGYIPKPAGGLIPLAAILVKSGATKITWDEIYPIKIHLVPDLAKLNSRVDTLESLNGISTLPTTGAGKSVITRPTVSTGGGVSGDWLATSGGSLTGELYATAGIAVSGVLNTYDDVFLYGTNFHVLGIMNAYDTSTFRGNVTITNNSSLTLVSDAGYLLHVDPNTDVISSVGNLSISGSISATCGVTTSGLDNWGITNLRGAINASGTLQHYGEVNHYFETYFYEAFYTYGDVEFFGGSLLVGTSTGGYLLNVDPNNYSISSVGSLGVAGTIGASGGLYVGNHASLASGLSVETYANVIGALSASGGFYAGGGARAGTNSKPFAFVVDNATENVLLGASALQTSEGNQANLLVHGGSDRATMYIASTRSSGSAAMLGFVGQNANAGYEQYAAIMGVPTVATVGAETGHLGLYSMTSGSLALRMKVGDGITIGEPASSFKGAGTLNAAGNIYAPYIMLRGSEPSVILSDIDNGEGEIWLRGFQFSGQLNWTVDHFPAVSTDTARIRTWRNSTIGQGVFELFRGDGTATLDHAMYTNGGYVGGNPVGGDKGLGTVNIQNGLYAATVELSGTAPRLTFRDTEFTGGTTTLEAFQFAGVHHFNLEQTPAAPTQQGLVRFWRTSTINGGVFEICRGDNTNTRDHQFYAGGGYVVGGATGGDKGVGTINVKTDIYKNNTAYTNPDFVFELYHQGEVVKHIDKPGAKEFKYRSIDELREYTEANHQFPNASNTRGAFERFDWLLAQLELVTTHLYEMHDRVQYLETKLKER